MGKDKIPDLREFRGKAIKELENLKSSYLQKLESTEEDTELARFEKAIRLLPGLIKTEEYLLESVEETERRVRLERTLEPLFSALRRVLGADFDKKREEILEALENELKLNGARR